MRFPRSSIIWIQTLVALALGDLIGPGVLACYLYNIDFHEYDVNKFFSGAAVESPQRCQEFCQADPLCSYWTYIREPPQCYLKSQDAPLGRTPKFGALSGPKVCTQTRTCFDHGADYQGHDVDKLEGGTVNSAEACQSICLWRDDCHFWTYIASKRACYLKDQWALQSRIVDPDAISGPERCP